MKSRSSAVIVALAFMAFITIGFNAGISGVAWPSMRDTFGVTQDAIGSLLMLSTVGALAMNISSGPLITRIGLGTLLLIGCIIASFGYLGYAMAPTWWLLIAFGLVAAIGTTGLIAGLNTFFAINQTARLMIWLQACFGLGAILSPAVMTFLLDTGYTWRWAYIVVVLLLAGLALGFALTLNRWRLARPGAGESAVSLGARAEDAANVSDDLTGPAAPGLRSGQTLKIPAVWLSLLLFFVLTGMESSAAQWPYTLFTEGRNIDPRIAGLWVSLFWTSLTAGRLFFGFVINLVGPVPLVRLTMLGTILGAALLWWNVSDPLSFIGFALIGFAVSPLFPVLTSNTPERIGSQHAAEVIGFQLASVRLGLAAVPALAGVMAAAYGLEIIGPFLFTAAIVMFVLHEGLISGLSAAQVTLS